MCPQAAGWIPKLQRIMQSCSHPEPSLNIYTQPCQATPAQQIWSGQIRLGQSSTQATFQSRSVGRLAQNSAEDHRTALPAAKASSVSKPPPPPEVLGVPSLRLQKTEANSDLRLPKQNLFHHFPRYARCRNKHGIDFMKLWLFLEVKTANECGSPYSVLGTALSPS